jgi:hypothetical protein
MEIARMNYTFTAVLIILICLLTIFADPAYPKEDKFLKTPPKDFILLKLTE